MIVQNNIKNPLIEYTQDMMMLLAKEKEKNFSQKVRESYIEYWKKISPTKDEDTLKTISVYRVVKKKKT